MPQIAKLKTLTAEYLLESDEPLGPVVAEWNELLQDYGVWNRFEKSRAERKKKTSEDLKRLGLNMDEAAMRKFANAGLVEVEVSTDNPLAWELPWEYWLTVMTERFRARVQSLLVLRFLKKAAHNKLVPPSKLLVLKSNPEYLANLYSDQSLKYEETNVSENLGLKADVEAHNLTIAELRKVIRAFGPDVIHVAGIDSWQAMAFKYADQKEAFSVKTVKRGLMMKAPNDTADIADTEQLVKALCSRSSRSPRLVALNFSRSAAIAAATVQAGAHAALGFYNDIDDLIAESFFTNFYLAWRLSKWNLLDAFRLAWGELVEEIKPEKLFGSGIVLWASESLLKKEKSRRKESNINVSPSRPATPLRQKFDKEANRALIPDPISKAILVRIRELSELNYCLLHNNRNLFHWFFVRKILPQGVLRNVGIRVSLHVGSERLVFRTRKDLRYPIWNLVDSVRIPLTAALPRALQESIYTGLHVRITVGNTPVFENTFRVNLLPVDQWQNDDENRQWLPSFILPRDPAIRKLVNVAQKYLAAISDNPSVGFNAYMDEAEPELVDAQVKALWFGMQNDFSLSYITQPPSFKEKAQRLRSPSSVMEGKRGTCIDLALLFAAALEYVEIYPVIILFTGHALVGFYSSKEAHDKIRDYMDRNASSDEQAWMLGKAIRPVIEEMINAKELVGLETVGLTKHQSFESAMAEGTKRILDGIDFEYLVDIHLAREGGVTPLPI